MSATDLEEAAGGPAMSSMGPPAEVEQLRAYLLRTSPVLLEEDVLPDVESLQNQLKSSEAKLKKFIEDPQERALFVVKTVPLEEGEGEGAESSGFKSTYDVRLGLNYRTSRCIGVAFIKRGAVMEADKSIRSQLRVMNFSEDSPFETLHAYVKDAMTPFFNSFVLVTKKTGEGDKLVPSVQKKINELEVGLLHLQQNIDIPEISLPIHPTIQGLVESKKKPVVEDLGASVSDSTFLNALQKDVSRWIREIQKVTKLERDASSGTALQEITFWINLENALNKIHRKRNSTEVNLTLEILKAGKRFHATVSFDSDTGLKEAQDKVNDYSPLMKDFPIDEMHAANDLEAIRAAVASIYGHLRKIRNTSYPAQRAIYLVEAISRDLNTQLLKVLSTGKLVQVSYEVFDQVMSRCDAVFGTWDDEYDKFTSQLREMSKKKREESLLKFSWRAFSAHKKLQDRIFRMKEFRKQHEQLQAVIVRVLRPTTMQGQPAPASVAGGNRADAGDVIETDDLSAVREVKLAYENVKGVDCLDLTPEGNAAWEAALKRYDERIDRVETRIAARLRDQLGTAKSANEMFRIFSRYNALFVRAHIRGAIREYQAQLIQRVKDDIESLHNKFKMQYSKTTTHMMCTKLDFPPVSSAIIWARQIDRQLQTYLHRVEAVLGKGWEVHVEGQKLKQDGEAFRQKLNTQQLFEDWKKKVESRQQIVQGRIFNISSQRTRHATLLKLQVNFAPETITLAKEVRNLKWLGFRVPFAIVNQANQANQLYPHAVSLMESIRTYELTCQKIHDHRGISPLVAAMKSEVQELVREGCNITWESYKLESFVQKFSELIFSFQERVDDVLLYTTQIDGLILSLENCEYKSSMFRDVLDQVQKLIDDLNLRSYSNLPAWVRDIDSQVESKLIKRLSLAIQSWTECLNGIVVEGAGGADTTMDTTSSGTAQPQHKLGGTPELEVVRHELHITNQIMHLRPPVEMGRCRLVGQLHEWINTVAALPRIQSSRYQVGLVEISPTEATYRSLLGKLMRDNSSPLVKAYAAIEDLLKEVTTYVNVWLQYQSLWDMEFANVHGRLEVDLARWQKLLMDVKRSRKTIDTTDTMKSFGPVEIHYGKVQQKVTLKYDSWHREILSRFGSLLGDDMHEFHNTIAKVRREKEGKREG